MRSISDLNLFWRRIWTLECIVVGTWIAAAVNFSATYPLTIGAWSFPGYIALYTLALNLAVATVLTPLFNAMTAKSTDQTIASDYYA